MVQSRVLSWRSSITMQAAFCAETLEDAIARYGKPEVFNTDQDSQFTGAAFTGAPSNNGIAISMDGKGAKGNNVFVERLGGTASNTKGVSASLRQHLRRPQFHWPLPGLLQAVARSSLDGATPLADSGDRLTSARGGQPCSHSPLGRRNFTPAGALSGL
jgi:transposase InsO family protein